jgi:hypothetical protein
MFCKSQPEPAYCSLQSGIREEFSLLPQGMTGQPELMYPAKKDFAGKSKRPSAVQVAFSISKEYKRHKPLNKYN